MKVSLFRVLQAVYTPLKMLLHALYEVIIALVQVLAGAPATTAGVLSRRLSQKAASLDRSLDRRAEAKHRRGFEKQLENALSSLFFSEGFLLYEKGLKQAKTLIIVLLEAVSFTTTYRGLVQALSSLHWLVPLCLAIVIQTGLSILASTISCGRAPWTHRILLPLFLIFSIAISFFGVSESFLPYEQSVREEYSAFASDYNAARAEAQALTQSNVNPLSAIDGTYDLIGQLLSHAQELYNSQTLADAEAALAGYQSMTTPVTVSTPSTTTVDAEGNTTTKSGGTAVITVNNPDPDLISAGTETVKQIGSQMKLIDEIQGLLSGDCSQEHIKSVMELQLSSDVTLPEFTQLGISISSLLASCGELAAGMGRSIDLSLELSELLQEYNRAGLVSSTVELPTYQALYTAWQAEEYRPAQTGSSFWDGLLASFAVNTPSRLKSACDQAVFDAYTSLSPVLKQLGLDTAALDASYGEYAPQVPFVYYIRSLSPSGKHFHTALLAAAIACINDGLAVAVGLFMGLRSVSWLKNRTLTRSDLSGKAYTQFRNVLIPLVKDRLKGRSGDLTIADVCSEVSGILSDFLDRFTLQPGLAREGFSRYAACGDLDASANNLLGFLSTWGMVKGVSAEQAATLGLISSAGQAGEEGYWLLSIRGENWLMEKLGSASDMGFDTLISYT